MKKRLILLTTLCAFFVASRAQINGMQKNADEIQFNGYLIRLFQTTNHGYGYDIFFQHTLIVHQDNNPYTNTPEGLKQRDDAIKTAKWQVIHIPHVNRQLQLRKQTIPLEVARQLNISIK